jgi:hypothetical protein
MIDNFVQEEMNRVYASNVVSDFEDSVKSEIIIWGYEQNIAREAKGQPTIKQDFKDLAADFWNDRISSFGKLRAIRN